MTGRKVTRRASMRRKSMRSPSISRSAGSKTPRSVNSEPNASGNVSFNSSSDKLESELTGCLASLPANNSSERLSKAQVQSMSNPVAIFNDSLTALSSSEQLANELAAVKIADSKENLAEVAKEESKVSLNEFVAKNPSKGSLNDLAKKNPSKGSINDLARNKSTSSLNKSESNISKLSRSKSEFISGDKSAESVKTEAMKSADELVAVSLNEPRESEEVVDEKEPEPVASETVAPVEAAAPAATEAPTEAAPAESTETPADVKTEGEEETKKSCLAQRVAKCRCIIS